MNFILPSITINIERWKWNKKYQVFVSNRGRVKNIDGKVLKAKTTQKGYLAVRVKAKKAVFIHRLVMETWRPIPNPEEMTVDHLDHNKRNNDIRNLEWVTEKENHKRAADDLLVEKEIALIKTKEMIKHPVYIILIVIVVNGSMILIIMQIIYIKQIKAFLRMCSLRQKLALQELKINQPAMVVLPSAMGIKLLWWQ